MDRVRVNGKRSAGHARATCPTPKIGVDMGKGKGKAATLKAAEKRTGLTLDSSLAWPVVPAPHNVAAVYDALLTEMVARHEWYLTHEATGGIPRKVDGRYTLPQRSALTLLERAKGKLTALVDGVNFKDAARRLNYAVQYAPRIRL